MFTPEEPAQWPEHHCDCRRVPGSQGR